MVCAHKVGSCPVQSLNVGTVNSGLYEERLSGLVHEPVPGLLVQAGFAPAKLQGREGWGGPRGLL